MEDDQDVLEDDQNLSLHPFKCYEMILNYKGKMIDEVDRTEVDLQTKLTKEVDLQTTEDDLQTMEDDLQTAEDDPPSIIPL